jgi:hypothetical protein
VVARGVRCFGWPDVLVRSLKLAICSVPIFCQIDSSTNYGHLGELDACGGNLARDYDELKHVVRKPQELIEEHISDGTIVPVSSVRKSAYAQANHSQAYLKCNTP